MLAWVGAGRTLPYYGAEDFGLLALGVGAILAAVATFIPQFYLPPAARIGHGVLVAVGCALLAITLLGGERATQRPVQQGGITEAVA